MKIHLLGPSGSGTSTLGQALAHSLGCYFVDADSLFWLVSDPPFTHKRPFDERRELLLSTISPHQHWVLSGSVLGWGDSVRELADLLIYKYLEPKIRIPRLLAREYARHGRRIQEGGDMEESHQAFISWAQGYETGGMEQRSRSSEQAWLKGLESKTILLEGARSTVDELDLVHEELVTRGLCSARTQVR